MFLTERPVHIFLVDDDADDRMLFQEAMNELSPQIKLSLAEGCNMLANLSKVEKELPDMILLDLNMPGINGFECLDEIKKQKLFGDVPVLIYSTTANPDQVQTTYKKGASLYMQKPTSYEGIKSLMKKLLTTDLSSVSAIAQMNNVVFKA